MSEPDEPRITVAIVDDHPLVRAGLRSVLESAPDLEVVGEAADGDEVAALIRSSAPRVLLLDLSMPRLGGIEALRALQDDLSETRVVVLTSYSDRGRVQQALSAGAVGYLLKDSEPGDLLAGVRAAGRGHVPIDPRVAGVLLDGVAGAPDARPAPAASTLSGREREVLAEVSRGQTNRQIARRLGITEGTVKAHLGNIYRQIGVLDRTSAALWARDHLGR